MKKGRIFAAMAALVLLTAAKPQDSGYSDVAQKPEAKISNQDVTSVREESVHPEEVYKYGVQEFALIASDTGYFPQRIFVRKNIPVKLFVTSGSQSPQCFVLDDFSIRKGVGPQQVEEIRFLPTHVGQYKFYCPKQEIEGSLVVRD